MAVKSEVNVSFRTEAFIKAVKDTMREEVEQVALDTAALARESILRGPPRTGEVYTVDGKTETRSAPGEPPKTDGGMLASSITHPRFSVDRLEAIVSAEAPYAADLEQGSSKMAKRPYMVPALNEAMQKHRKRRTRVFRSLIK